MKLCMLTDAWTPVWGGGQTHIWQTCQHLTFKSNVYIDIIAPNLISSDGKTPPKLETFNHGRLRVLRLGPKFIFPSLLGRLQYCFAVCRYVLMHKYDIYHSHSLSTSGQLALAKVFHYKTKIYYTVHGGVREMLGSRILNYLKFASIADLIIRRLIPFDGLIGVVDSDIQGPVLAKNKWLIANGVDNKVFAHLSQKKFTKVVRILNVGRLVPVKNQRNLILAFGRLAKKNSHLRLKIIGDGVLYSELQELINKINLQEVIEIKSFLPPEKTLSLYLKTDIFVLPSLFEGFPITLLEAMACRIPIIVSKAGNCAEVVRQASAGIVLSGTEIIDIQQGLEKMLSLTNSQKRQMGDSARQWVLKKYTWDKVSEELYAIYTRK